MKILLHACCAPCSIHPVELLRSKGLDVTGYFFNPNIHPYTEFRKRLEALEKYAAEIEMETIIDPGYHLEEFLRGAVYRESNRCGMCYAMRLEQAAKMGQGDRYLVPPNTGGAGRLYKDRGMGPGFVVPFLETPKCMSCLTGVWGHGFL